MIIMMIMNKPYIYIQDISVYVFDSNYLENDSVFVSVCMRKKVKRPGETEYFCQGVYTLW